MEDKAKQRALEKYPLLKTEIGDLNELPRIGYLAGYHQAEKDLALTWEDVRDICRMWIESKTPFGVTGEALSIEVLNRFNKQKEDGKIQD